MNKSSLAVAGAVLLTLAGIDSAEAASFNFSYILESGNELAGMLEGDLQSDGDTIFVNAITMPTFNGLAAPELPFTEAFSTFLGGPDTEAKVSFSGLIMDVIACTDSNCFDGFLFDSSGAAFGDPAYSSGISYGDTFEIYAPARWTLTAKAAEDVPEPATLLGLLAVGGLGLTVTRKQTA